MKHGKLRGTYHGNESEVSAFVCEESEDNRKGREYCSPKDTILSIVKEKLTNALNSDKKVVEITIKTLSQ